jgi:GT2 family glycosyltransferase/glycosyltransferase involved in cell wall biosynthesis
MTVELKRTGDRRQMILVLGMHRSGTSAVTGMLAHLGVEASDRLIPAAEDNPKGFFEHADIWSINQDLLQELESDWDDPAPLPADWTKAEATREAGAKIREVLRRDFASSLAVIKDPRLCRLMPLWRDVLTSEGYTVKIVLAVRAPLDVVASLVKRDALRAAEAAGVWLRYQLEAEAATRGDRRVVVPYEDLLRDWQAQARRVATALQVTWPRAPDAVAAQIDAFIDPGLRHHDRSADSSAQNADLAPPLADWLDATHAALTQHDAIATARLDGVAQALSRVDHDGAIYAAPLQRLRLKSRRLQGELDWQREEAKGMAAGNAYLEDQLQRHAAERKDLMAGNAYLEDQLQQRSDQLQQRTTERDQLAVDKRRLEARGDALQNELALVYASRSWRITRPMRAVLRRYQRLRGRQPSGPAAGQAVDVGSPEGPPGEAPEDLHELQQQAMEKLEAAAAQATGPRVLIATPDIVGPIRNGGIGTAFHALARTLADAGHAVTILYTLGDHCEGGTDIAFWQRHYASFGVRFVPLRPDKDEPRLDAPWHCERAYRLYLWMKQRQHDYDVAYFPEWKGEAYYALQARRLGLDFEHLAMVIVTHSPTAWAASGNYELPTDLAALDLDYMERRVAEMADVVVSPSQYMLDWVEKCGWKLIAPTRVVQNLMVGRLPDESADAPSVVVHEWVFFGRLELRKGLRIFLDALARVPVEQRGWHAITFLGKATKTPQFDPVALIHDALGEWPQPVKILGDYDRDQALDYLKQPGRLAIIASLVENSPYTVLECLLARVPFVAADVGGIAELVHAEDRARVLFKPNPAALAATLARLDDGAWELPRPAVSAEATRRQWLLLQDDIQAFASRGFEALPGELPHITVCLVHFDRPQMLARAIESLRQQTYDRFDVVLVDDGSPSARAQHYLDELESEFARRDWTIVRQDNAYLGAARNAAARHARGEYVLFMDDDNVAKPHELAVFARAARYIDADILTTVSDVFSDAEGPRLPERSRELWIPLGNAAGLGVFRNVFGDANALVRRSVFESVGGFTEDYGVGHEDWEFFVRATLAGARLYLVPEPLVWYRVDTRSMLRRGHARTDHARSVRPYREALTGSVGASLAFSLYLQRQAQMSPQAAATAATESGGQGHYARFLALRRAAGWRVAVARTLHYIVRSFSGH